MNESDKSKILGQTYGSWCNLLNIVQLFIQTALFAYLIGLVWKVNIFWVCVRAFVILVLVNMWVDRHGWGTAIGNWMFRNLPKN